MSTSEPPATLRRPLLIFTNAFDPKPVTVIYALGIVSWIFFTLALGFESKETDICYALLEVFGSAWQTAFLWSLAVVAATTAAYCLVRKKSLLVVAVNTMIYASPFALFLLGTWTLDGLYDQHPATVEMIKLFGPILILFYIIGIAYMIWRTPGGREEALPAFMLSTLTAVILVLGLTGFKLLSSNEYVYRNAFNVAVEGVNRQGNIAQVQGVLTINKAGPYVFSVIGNERDFFPHRGEDSPTIEWIGKPSAPSEIGEYKFRITMPNAGPSRSMSPEGGGPMNPLEMFPQGPDVYLQISLPATDGKSSAFLKGLPIWLEAF